MLLHELQSLFQRDLNRLKQEIEQYKDEQTIWRIDKDIKNSAGNLTLHLIGNLNHFIGVVLGKTDYIRNRDLEFSMKDVPRSELVTNIEETASMIEKVLSKLPETVLPEEYPVIVFDKKTSTQFMLVHLVTHLNYHLGQVNYHRRLLDN
ncbi:DUF1572 family protein [Flavisolibacter tropicus]|uniref:DinB superfamily protein n=1 Tax=Flavisolibacter tropicus TaxID=1492898 RepID=A0A172TXZ1_9BACT|nr:DUF1572 family protein [Flavisolibacter tropicus]ANE51852.1 DinB superfamily protein [Flavisolibacter tropicus]